MQLTDKLIFTQDSDINSGVMTDASDYGVGGNPARSDTANYLGWTKTDSNGNRTYLTHEQGDVLTNLVYPIPTPYDGYYEAILMRISLYNPSSSYVEEQKAGSVITQYASIVYDGKSYKCIAPVSGIAPTDPGGSNYWQLVVDFPALIPNPNVHIFIQKVYIKTRSMTCAAKQFNSSCGCGCDGDLEKIRTPLLITSKLMGADAEFVNGNPTEMQKIIEEITSICSTCGS